MYHRWMVVWCIWVDRLTTLYLRWMRSYKAVCSQYTCFIDQTNVLVISCHVHMCMWLFAMDFMWRVSWESASSRFPGLRMWAFKSMCSLSGLSWTSKGHWMLLKCHAWFIIVFPGILIYIKEKPAREGKQHQNIYSTENLVWVINEYIHGNPHFIGI